MPNANSSWLAHIGGLERLFALQGPPRSEERNRLLDRALANTCRPVLILAAFFTGKPSIMGQRGWKARTQCEELDEVRSGDAVKDMAFLMDLLAELPAIFRDCDECIACTEPGLFLSPPPPALVDLTSLWDRITHLQHELRAWKAVWDLTHQNDVMETITAAGVESVDSALATPWPTALQFSSIELANTFTMSHAVSILLHSCPTALLAANVLPPPPYPSCTPPSPSTHPYSSPFDLTTSSIHSIGATIAYYLSLSSPQPTQVDYHLFFPLHVARRAAARLGEGEQVAWLGSAEGVMRERYSMGLWANMDFEDRFGGGGEGMFG